MRNVDTNPMRNVLMKSLLISMGLMAPSVSEESVDRFFPTGEFTIVPKLPSDLILQDSKDGACLPCTTSALQ